VKEDTELVEKFNIFKQLGASVGIFYVIK